MGALVKNAGLDVYLNENTMSDVDYYGALSRCFDDDKVHAVFYQDSMGVSASSVGATPVSDPVHVKLQLDGQGCALYQSVAGKEWLLIASNNYGMSTIHSLVIWGWTVDSGAQPLLDSIDLKVFQKRRGAAEDYGDVDKNLRVNLTDLGALANSWLLCNDPVE